MKFIPSKGDVSQWEDGKLPCPKQVAIFPEEIMFVPKKYQFGQKTILPNNGILLFEDQGNLIKKDRKKKSGYR